MTTADLSLVESVGAEEAASVVGDGLQKSVRRTRKEPVARQPTSEACGFTVHRHCSREAGIRKTEPSFGVREETWLK